MESLRLTYKLRSIPQRRSLHLDPASPRRRPEPLRAGIRAVVADPERGDDTDKCDVDAGGAE